MASQVSSHAFSLGLNLTGIGLLTGVFSAYLFINPSTPIWTLIISSMIGLFGSCYSIMHEVEKYVSQQAV